MCAIKLEIYIWFRNQEITKRNKESSSYSIQSREIKKQNFIIKANARQRNVRKVINEGTLLLIKNHYARRLTSTSYG